MEAPPIEAPSGTLAASLGMQTAPLAVPHRAAPLRAAPLRAVCGTNEPPTVRENAVTGPAKYCATFLPF